MSAWNILIVTEVFVACLKHLARHIQPKKLKTDEQGYQVPFLVLLQDAGMHNIYAMHILNQSAV